MKKYILTILAIITFSPLCYAGDSYYAYASKSNSSNKEVQQFVKEIKSALKQQLEYTNENNIEGMKTFYAPNYVNSDGITKENYFELVKKTWKLYPDIKYTMNITNIDIIGNTAVVETKENADATSVEKVGDANITGYLKSNSSSVYYLEKIGDNWVITSDHIINECTKLTYGEANTLEMELVVPQLVQANKDYTASLKVKVPDKKMIVIASIGQEPITYPQVNAEEVFRKLPQNGILERIFTANKDNFNEYIVASVGITRAKVGKNKDIKLQVTGLGYVITRSNVVPVKDFSKVKQNGKEKTSISVK